MSEKTLSSDQLATELQCIQLAIGSVNLLWEAGVLALLERDAIQVRLYGALDRLRVALQKASDVEMLQAVEDTDQVLLPLEEDNGEPAYCFMCGKAPCECPTMG